MRAARLLLVFTLLYNVVEGIVAIWSGISARSLALVAFGADSYLEVAAAGVVLWRLGAAESEESERKERQAGRFVALTFLVLAAGIIFQVGWNLLHGAQARESWVGLALAAASVVIMPGLALVKLRVATKRQVRVLALEAKETLACSYLSITLLFGLVATAALGWWWLDSATALLLTPWLVKEGMEGFRGEEEEEQRRLCSCRECLFGIRSCQAACCAA